MLSVVNDRNCVKQMLVTSIIKVWKQLKYPPIRGPNNKSWCTNKIEYHIALKKDVKDLDIPIWKDLKILNFFLSAAALMV